MRVWARRAALSSLQGEIEGRGEEENHIIHGTPSATEESHEQSCTRGLLQFSSSADVKVSVGVSIVSTSE